MHNIEYWKIEYWQLATDFALACSLIFLGYRLSRGTRSVKDAGKLASLEGSLRGLLAEAGQASTDLNQQLVKRQQTLEKLLFDLQSTESRINRSVSTAEQQHQALSAQIETSRSAMLDMSRIPARVEAEAFEQRAPEPPSFERAARAAPTTSQRAEPPAQHRQAPTKSPQTNIYGEILESEEATPPSFNARESMDADAHPKSLASTIEKQVSHQTTQETLEHLYGAAERMLRAGKEVERVALQTDLPIDEVRILSQLIMKEREAEEIPDHVASAQPAAKDERLGVLGGIRRQVQTL